MLTIVVFNLVGIVYMLKMIKHYTWVIPVSYILITINILMMFKVLCGDPGISPKTYRYYSKLNQEPFNPDPDLTSDSDTGNKLNPAQKGYKI